MEITAMSRRGKVESALEALLNEWSLPWCSPPQPRPNRPGSASDRDGDEIRDHATGTPPVIDRVLATPGQPPMSCGQCGDTSAAIFLAMVPGVDGAPWHLCSTCWREAA